MNLQRRISVKLFVSWRCYFHRLSTISSINEISVNSLCKNLDINFNVAQNLAMKHPIINKLCDDNINKLVETVRDVGFDKEVLVKEPQLFGVLPVTIKFRYKVLIECGVKRIHPKYLTNYLAIMKKKTIGDLKKSGILLTNVNIENRLASYMTQWPTSLTASIQEDINKLTLYDIRLKIIQRYLELLLDLTEEEFHRGIKTYPTIKHRPLAVINETLIILQSQVMIPTHKIKSNMYLIHADPENLKNIIFKIRYLGGIDVKEIIRLHPKIALRNYNTLVEIKNILKEYGIDDEAQRRCFDIYTLGSHTVRERLEKAKSIPEFHTFYNHPRFLKMIHYNKTAVMRMTKLYNTNKKCLSLNILSGSSAHYDTFEKTPGDRMGKGKDLIFCISQSLGKKYKSRNIHKKIKRHPFWLNIALVQVQYVYRQLSFEFSSDEIYENCAILLYPWDKIRDTLNSINKTPNYENINVSNIDKSKKLSLVLYALEKEHYFTGNGVWSEEKNKSSSS